MALFSKKTTLVHNITYMAITTAINLVFIVLDTFVPFMMLLLILLLPFVSAVVSYFCQKRYYIIYAVASVGLCLIFSISSTIFYIIPALCSGFVIGLLLDKKVHPFWMILSSTLIEDFRPDNWVFNDYFKFIKSFHFFTCVFIWSAGCK